MPAFSGKKSRDVFIQKTTILVHSRNEPLRENNNNQYLRDCKRMKELKSAVPCLKNKSTTDR